MRSGWLGLALWLAWGAAQAAGVTVQDAWVRAMPPGARTSAAFLTLHNGDDRPHALVGAASDVARLVELHTHLHDHGVMRMRPVARIAIPAHGSVRLQPGGYHIMLIDLRHPIRAGDSVALTLRLEDGSTLAVQAEARGPRRGAMPAMPHHPPPAGQGQPAR